MASEADPIRAPETSERMVPGRQISLRQHLLLLRHEFPYRLAAERLPAGARVLEVGCGEGYGARGLRERAGAYVGLDVDRGVAARARASHGGPRAGFLCARGDRMGLRDGVFDAALCFQVIEHLRDDRGLLREIRRVLRPGGVLLLTTPNRALRLRPGQRPWNRHHVREYDAATLRALVGELFEDVAVRGVRASAEVEQMERERLRDIRRLAALDVLGLRDRVPERLRQWLARRVETRRRAESAQAEAEARARFGPSDFQEGGEDLDAALDLVVWCRRPAARDAP